MSAIPAKIPPGLHLSAVATQPSEVVGGVNAKGRPYQKTVLRGVAGSKFVKCTQFVEAGHVPLVFQAGETFEADITGVDTFEKGREIISLFVELRRPTVAGAQK